MAIRDTHRVEFRHQVMHLLLDRCELLQPLLSRHLLCTRSLGGDGLEGCRVGHLFGGCQADLLHNVLDADLCLLLHAWADVKAHNLRE